MSSLLMPIMNGITFGALLFLCASGFTLVFGLMRVVNMSYGMLYLLGSYVGLSIQRATGNWILAIVGGAVAVALLTGVLELFLLRRVQGDPLRETLLTLGVSYIIGDLLLAFYGGIPKLITAPTYVRRAVNLGLMKYPGTRLFMLGTAVVIGIGLWLLMSKTRIDESSGLAWTTRKWSLPWESTSTACSVLCSSSPDFWRAQWGDWRFLSGLRPRNRFYHSYLLLVVADLGGMGSLGGGTFGSALRGIGGQPDQDLRSRGHDDLLVRDPHASSCLPAPRIPRKGTIV